MKKKQPKISVLLVFYNTEQYIEEAIKSVLNQSFQDFELVLVDDGSTDMSVQIVNRFNDERIRLILNNHDYISSLNFGLDYALGKYIARMDADDIMHPDRLFVQYRLMEDKPWIDFCSSWCTFFDERTGKKALLKEGAGKITDPLVSLLYRNIFTHPTMIFKKEFIKNHNLRYSYFSYAEDYKMWVDAAKLGATFYIEPQSLLFYRCHDNQISIIKRKEQEETSNQIKKEIIDYLFLSLPKELQELYECLCSLKSKEMVTTNYMLSVMYNIFKYNKIQK